MVARRWHLASTQRRLGGVAAASPAFERIGSVSWTAFLPTIAQPLASDNTSKHKIRSARAWARSFILASALCASTFRSADGATPGYLVPGSYPAACCDDPVVFDRITAEFRGRFWTLGVAVIDIRAHEASWDSWPQYRIPRRFCAGTIIARRGNERQIYDQPIYYAIIADGRRYEVEWCVVGLDRAWPYDRRCRLARP